MAEEAVETPPETPPAEKVDDEQHVPYERFKKANTQAKEAKTRAEALERQVAELTQRVEDRESAGLPELEQLKKRLEQAEKAREAAEAKAEQVEAKATTAQRRSLVVSAASDAGFKYPNVVANLDEIDLDAIEDEDAAVRAVKRAAKKYPDLLKGDDPKLPGRVLENGKPAPAATVRGGIDANAEAQSLAAGLKQFTDRWHTTT